MPSTTHNSAILGAALVGCGSLGVSTVCLLQGHSLSRLIPLCLFMLTLGTVTVLGTLLCSRANLAFRICSLKTHSVLATVMTASISLVTAGFITTQMVFSTGDLAVLAGVLGYSVALSVFVALATWRSASISFRETLTVLHSMNIGCLKVRALARLPTEVGALAQEVNLLAERMETGLAQERDFVRDVSHDLRTPLAAVRAMVESINDGVVDDPQTIRRYLRATQSELEHLDRLISDLFDLSRIGAENLALQAEPESIGDLISDTIESISAHAAAHQLVLDGRVEEGLPLVRMDTRLIQRVLNNLVHNAVRHTPPGGLIFLNAQDSVQEVRIDVVDTGEGVTLEEGSRLLGMAKPVDQPSPRALSGSGLGLGIVMGIVEAHGGRFWLESNVGEGSRFSFTLPK